VTVAHAPRARAKHLFGPVHVVYPPDFFGRLDGLDFEVHNDWVLPASDHHTLERLVWACVNLLVRNEWRHVNEIAWTGFGGELELITPTHASASLDDVDHAFKFTVMMSTSFGIGMDGDRSCPELRGSGSRVGDRSGAIHPRCLRRICIELTGANDTNAMMFPVACCVAQGAFLLLSLSVRIRQIRVIRGLFTFHPVVYAHFIANRPRMTRV
jgi:hypothetical protein